MLRRTRGRQTEEAAPKMVGVSKNKPNATEKKLDVFDDFDYILQLQFVALPPGSSTTSCASHLQTSCSPM